MEFLSDFIEVIASCFLHDDKEWNIRRIFVAIVVVIAVVVLGFLFSR
jgi:hypothetical protein